MLWSVCVDNVVSDGCSEEDRSRRRPAFLDMVPMPVGAACPVTGKSADRRAGAVVAGEGRANTIGHPRQQLATGVCNASGAVMGSLRYAPASADTAAARHRQATAGRLNVHVFHAGQFPCRQRLRGVP